MMNKGVLRIIVLLFVFSACSVSYAFYYKTTPLPEPRQMYGTAVLGDYLYVVGGEIVSGWTNTVIKAPILPNGNIGAWTPTTPLPTSLAYIANTTMALNDVLYIIGGYDGNSETHTRTMLWTRPMPNGELEPWRESAPFPGEGIDNSVAVSTPGHIHLIGGFNDKAQPVNTILSAMIDERGDFVQWTYGTSLPTPLWFHNAAVVSGRVWVWGGLTGQENSLTNTRIYSAPILADGTIGTWRMEIFDLPEGFFRAACTASGPFLLTFCPSYKGGISSNDVWFAEASERNLSPWQKLATDIPNKLYIGVATDFRRKVIFLPGGRRRSGHGFDVDNAVYFFRLSKKAMADQPEENVVPTITLAEQSNTAPHLSYMYVQEKTKDAFNEFQPYEIARQQSKQHKMPLILYFNSPTATPCERQRQLLQQFNFNMYRDKLNFGWVDSTLLPQLVQQLGVFRVPCWIYFDASNKELKRKYGILNEEELQKWLFGG